MPVIEARYFFIAAFSATGFVSLVVAWVAWEQRRVLKSTSVVAFMIGVAIWCAAEAAHWAVSTFGDQRLWLALTYPGSSIVVFAFTVFALEISGVRSWLKRSRIAVFAGVCAACV